MSQHGLGLEGAAKALTVSKVVQRKIEERKVSMVQAIDDLTSKLSVTNLVRIESRSPSPAVPESPCCNEVGIPVVRATEMRIQPISLAQPRLKTTAATPTLSSIPSTITTTASAPTRKPKALNNNKNSNSNKQKNAYASNRKRSGEELKSDNNTAKNTTKKDDNLPPNRRERSDSLSEVVQAKFGGDAPVEEEAPARAAPVAVRAKRGRADECEAPCATMKRSRTASSGEL